MFPHRMKLETESWIRELEGVPANWTLIEGSIRWPVALSLARHRSRDGDALPDRAHERQICLAHGFAGSTRQRG
jgi:hypothetical protein